MSDLHFRIIVVASLVVGVVGATVDLVFPVLVAESLRDAQANEDSNHSIPFLLVVAALSLAATVSAIASTYGLFMFRSWAPRLAVLSTALVLLVVPLMGNFAQSGYAVAASYLSSYLWGAALLLAHLPQYRARFQGGNG